MEGVLHLPGDAGVVVLVSLRRAAPQRGHAGAVVRSWNIVGHGTGAPGTVEKTVSVSVVVAPDAYSARQAGHITKPRIVVVDRGWWAQLRPSAAAQETTGRIAGTITGTESNLPIQGVRVTLLGTGTSHGVPMIGCTCAVCRSTDPRDKRTRHGALITEGDEFDVGLFGVGAPFH